VPDSALLDLGSRRLVSGLNLQFLAEGCAAGSGATGCVGSRMELASQLGGSVLNALAYIGSLATLAWRAAYYTFVAPFQGKPLRLQRAVSQALDVGVRALPILSLITFFIGLILALQSAYELRKFGALDLVATAVAVSMTRELGPLITAIVVIGRSGSAFAAEIGTMKVTEEIDALETMAISPIHFLVTPKFLAMIVMLPCLTIWANSMGILGGALFGVAQADFTCARYIRTSIDALFLRDIVTGLIKSVMFGMTITAVGCLEGLNTGAGAEEVGRSTTRAVVMSIFMVVVVDLVFTMLFFFLGG
jgi:phospholipid/cholesterol/gamma-HCH transport system permease protein